MLLLLPGPVGTYTATARTPCETRTVALRGRLRDCASRLNVPNIFMFNDDGLNDMFQVLAPVPRPLRLQVFDR